MNNIIYGATTTTPIPMSSGGAANLEECASAIKNTVSGKSIKVTDVSPLPHKCSCRLTSEDGNLYKLNEANFDIMYPPATLNYLINERGILSLNGFSEEESPPALFYLTNLTIGEPYTFSIFNTKGDFIAPDHIFYLEENYGVGDNVENTTVSNGYTTFTPTKSGNCVAIVSVEHMMNTEFEVSLYPQLVLGESPVEKIFDFSSVTVSVNGASYPSTADGLVTNIESSPTMEITTDNPNVNIVDFTYCVDTKGYVKEYIEERLKSKVLLDVTLTEEQAGASSIQVAIPDWEYLKKAKRWSICISHPYIEPKAANAIWYTCTISDKNIAKYNCQIANGYNIAMSTTSENTMFWNIAVFNTTCPYFQGGGSLVSFYQQPNPWSVASAANSASTPRSNSYVYRGYAFNDPAYLTFANSSNYIFEAGTKIFLEVFY